MKQMRHIYAGVIINEEFVIIKKARSYRTIGRRSRKKNMKEKEPILTKNFIFIFTAQFLRLYIHADNDNRRICNGFWSICNDSRYGFGFVCICGLISRLCSLTFNRFGWKRIAMIFSLYTLWLCCYFLAENVVLLIVIRFIHGLGFGASANAIMVVV